MVSLSNTEADRIVQRILPELGHYADQYDQVKYPSPTYHGLIAAFQRPSHVASDDLRTALIWKYGHTAKLHFPEAHEKLIRTIQERWPGVASELATSAPKAFGVMDEAFGGPTRFITVAFLTHLVHPQTAPIIDQHNFRAVNHLIGKVREHKWPRKTPSSYEDISLLADFMHAVLNAWTRTNNSKAPDQIRLDRYLMMFGKTLKARNPN